MHVLGLLGVAEKSARQALARSAAEGWLSPARHGPAGALGADRPWPAAAVRGRAAGSTRSARAAPDWDGRWLLLLVSVPDAKRELRHRLRTRLAWAGFGALAGGRVGLPRPGPGGRGAARSWPGSAWPSGAMSFLGGYGSVGTPVRWPGRPGTWTRSAARYQDFIDGFARPATRPPGPTCWSPRPGWCTPGAGSRSSTRSCRAELLPGGWPGTRPRGCSTPGTRRGRPGPAALGDAWSAGILIVYSILYLAEVAVARQDGEERRRRTREATVEAPLPSRGVVRHRPGPVPALAAGRRRAGGHADPGRGRGRRPGRGLRAEDEQLRPGRGHRALRRRPAAAVRAPAGPGRRA